MKVYKIVFSPTGGTQKVADIIAAALSNDVSDIDLSKMDFSACSLESGSVAVIAVPSFGGRVPKTAIDRLKMIKANNAKAVVVAVYGNRAQEDTLIEAADTAKECGFEIVAGIAAIAEHSIAHQYAAGRPNANDAEQLKEFAQKILAKLNNSNSSKNSNNSQNSFPPIPGNHPYKKGGAGLVPKVTSVCVACGLCAEKCPVSAIEKSNPKRTNKSACINCMRCVGICPQHARTVSALMVKLVGVALKKSCSEPKANELFI